MKPTPPSAIPEKSGEKSLRLFGGAFLIALLVYAAAYLLIENRRTRKGPWEVSFWVENRTPVVAINQVALGITNAQIHFPGESAAWTNGRVTLRFGEARAVPFEVPFGRCIFMDATFLPGTLTFQLFGHEIELLPRVIMIDHEERPWRRGEPILLRPSPNLRSSDAPGQTNPPPR